MNTHIIQRGTVEFEDVSVEAILKRLVFVVDFKWIDEIMWYRHAITSPARPGTVFNKLIQHPLRFYDGVIVEHIC